MATTVARTLRFAARFRPNWDHDYAELLVRKFDLNPKQNVSTLSRGQRSALGVTLGLAARAPLTIFDESYLGMDAPSRYAFYDELLSDYAEHPRTIILSTHLIAELGTLFEDTIIIDNGRLVLHEDTDSLRGKGVTVTGPAAEVDRFVAGRAVLGERRLGGTKQATLFGQLAEPERDHAVRAGLELGPVPVQDLFVHLTRKSEEQR
jgi:ABC-2 type transport system ATP-binding protein